MAENTEHSNQQASSNDSAQSSQSSGPAAGWYPDPSGTAGTSRWWDGSKWTDQVRSEQSATVSATFSYAKDEPQSSAGASASAPEPNQAQSHFSAPAGATVNIYTQGPSGQKTYEMTDSDRTLRLIAFIFNLLSTIAVCWLIIPLIWMVPMTVISWGIYKGTKPNTVAFGVCTLIFMSIVSGILLLVSTKNEK